MFGIIQLHEKAMYIVLNFKKEKWQIIKGTSLGKSQLKRVKFSRRCGNYNRFKNDVNRNLRRTERKLQGLNCGERERKRKEGY